MSASFSSLFLPFRTFLRSTGSASGAGRREFSSQVPAAIYAIHEILSRCAPSASPSSPCTCSRIANNTWAHSVRPALSACPLASDWSSCCDRWSARRLHSLSWRHDLCGSRTARSADTPSPGIQRGRSALYKLGAQRTSRMPSSSSPPASSLSLS